MKRRLDPTIRRNEILQAALSVAERVGCKQLTRIQVAQKARCAESLISSYFGTMTQFRRTIMRAAVKTKNLKIIAYGLVEKDNHALKASPDLKKRALSSI
jgi:DNA-binding transcriptional regulator YbjK